MHCYKHIGITARFAYEKLLKFRVSMLEKKESALEG